MAAFAGTMKGSPPEAMVPKGILSESSMPGGAETVSPKSAGMTLADSFSTQEPLGMNRASPLAQAVCDWMWSRPGVPLRM